MQVSFFFFFLVSFGECPLSPPGPSMSLTVCRRHGFVCNHCGCCWKPPAPRRALSFGFFKMRGIWRAGGCWNSNSHGSVELFLEVFAPSLSAKPCWQCLWLAIVLPRSCEFIFHGYCKTCKIMCIGWNSRASMAKWNAFLQCCNLFLLLPSDSMAFLQNVSLSAFFEGSGTICSYADSVRDNDNKTVSN